MTSPRKGVKRAPTHVKLTIRLVLILLLSGPPAALFMSAWSAAIRPQVWPVWTKFSFTIENDALAGVSGDAEFSVSRFGLRGRPWQRRDRLRIIALGGSTTECAFLDETETWTNRLESEISRSSGSVWVGNGGRSGLSMKEHLTQIEPIVRLVRPDWLILMVGVNDLLRCLAETGESVSASGESRGTQRVQDRAFLEPGEAFTEMTTLARLRAASRAVRRRMSPRRKISVGPGLRADRRRRQNGARINNLPSIEAALIAYEDLLSRTIGLARTNEVQVVLVTQGHRWGNDNNHHEAQHWLGWAGSNRAADAEVYYSSEALAQGMTEFNSRMKLVGEKSGVRVVDLVGSDLDSETCFYDAVHLNEYGAKRVAEILAEAIDW